MKPQDYLSGLHIRVRYLHSDIHTVERVKILRELRIGNFDVLVGINLLREGLDLPEVSLVAVLDADKEGFLRSKGSLMQVAGRAARNLDGMVILYGDRITEAMNYLVNETDRRRTLQNEHNIKNNIIPESVYKSIDEIMISTSVADSKQDDEFVVNSHIGDQLPDGEKEMILIELRKSMMEAAEKLEFEKAAKIRDEIEIFEKETGMTIA